MFGSTVGGAVVDLVLNPTGFERGLTAADARLKTFAGTSGSTMARVSKGISTGLLVVGAAAAAVAGISIKAYMEEQVLLAKLDSALKRNAALRGLTAKALRDQAVAIALTTGTSHDEILAADAVLTRFSQTKAQLDELIPLTVDYARVTGIDASTAATQIGRSLLGNLKALKGLGIEYKATHDRAKDFAAITDLLHAKVDSAARDLAGTDAVKIDIMKEKLRLTEETIGQQLIPIFEKLLTIVSAALGWFTRLSPATQGNIIKFGLLAGTLGVLIKLFGPLIQLIGWTVAKLGAMVVAEDAAIGSTSALAAGFVALAPFILAAAAAYGVFWSATHKGDLGDVIIGRINAITGAVNTLNSAFNTATATAANFLGGADAAASKGYRYAPDTTRGTGGKQHGGPVDAGISYMVGEAGPEMFVPRVPGRIIPNGASGTGTTIIFQGPVYGFDDFKRHVVQAVSASVRQRIPA